MKRFASLAAVAAFLPMVACIQGSVDAPDTCTTQSVTFPAVPTADVGLVALGPSSTTADLSTVLNKLQSATTNLNVSITQLWIDNSNHDLDWVQSAQVSITGGNSSSPLIPLGTYTSTGTPSTQLNIALSLDETTLVSYLESGTVTLTYTIDGNITTANAPRAGALTNTVGMCFASSGDFKL